MAKSCSPLTLGTPDLRLQPCVNWFVCIKAVNPAAAHVLYQCYLLMKLHTHTQHPEERMVGQGYWKGSQLQVRYMKCEPIYLSAARSKTEQVSTSLIHFHQISTTLATFFEKSYRGKKEQIKSAKYLKG